MSIFFGIKIAQLNSFIRRLFRDCTRPGAYLSGFALPALILHGHPSPLHTFAVSHPGSTWYFVIQAIALFGLTISLFRQNARPDKAAHSPAAALAAMRDVFIRTNQHLQIETVNAAAIAQWEYSEQDLIGRAFTEVAEEREALEKYCESVRGGHRQELLLDMKIVCKSGGRVHANFSVSPIVEGEGVTGFVFVGRNIDDHKRAEEKMTLEKARLRQLFDNAPIGIVELDKSGKIIDLNSGFQSIFQFSLDEAREKALNDVIVPDNLKAEAEEHLHEISDGGAIFTDTVWKRKDGEPVHVSVYEIPIVVDGQPAGAYRIYIDITEHKQAEEALLRSQNRFRALIENSSDAVALVDAHGKFSYISPSVRRILGYAGEELIAHDVFELVHPDERPDLEVLFNELSYRPKGLVPFKCRVVHKNGSWRWAEGVAMNLLADPYVQAIVVNYRDITERRHAEETLKESETRMRNLFESDMLGIVFWDISGKVTEANKAFLEIAGYREEDILPEKEFLNDVRPLEYILLNERALQEMAATGACLPFETEYLRKDGTRVPILLGAALLEGHKDRGFCFVLDITQRKRAESERQAMFEIIQGVSSAENLDKLLHRIHQSLKKVIFAENCFILLYNKTTGMFDTTFFVDKFDRPFAPHQLGKSCTAYVFRTGQPLLLTQERFDQLMKEGEVELVGTNSPSWLGVPLKSATETIGVLVVQHYEDPNAYTQHDLEFLASIGNEIALAIERKRTEEQLRIFAHAFEGTTELLSLTDLNNRLVFVNKSFLQTYGCEEKEILGKGMHFFASPLNPPNIHEEIFERTQRASWSGELYNRKKDGTDFPISLNTSVIRDKEGKPIGYLGIAQDISERKRAEEQLKESYEQLRLLASRLQIIREEESMRIAREIHDDLGQALTGIKMDLSFFAEELGEQQGPGSKEKLIERINAMSSLVDGAITSMRKTITELRPAVLDSLGLAAAIEWQAEEFQRRTGTKCSYSYQVEDRQIDPHRSTAIFRILQESLTNVARHAQATKVSIVLKKESDAIVLDVQDNGKGISEEASHKVGSFGILGMKERVLPFGGSIDAHRLPGGGTSVTVRIPLA